MVKTALVRTKSQKQMPRARASFYVLNYFLFSKPKILYFTVQSGSIWSDLKTWDCHKYASAEMNIAAVLWDVGITMY